MFALRVFKEAERLIIRLSGDLDESNADLILKKLEDLASSGTKALLLDCQELDYVSAAGLEALERLYQHCVREKIPLVLYHLQARIRNIIELAGLSPHLPIARSKKDAWAFAALP
ncbi:anti-sigma B factor antagonist [Pontibacter ummariensis]|uniref:Anti-sigma factor antagonist n=1 Tax=Pontibacter ummariensis TaxID=1610492 RepID=A0A239KZ65_9BACT|nr:STAS domain-containing protein [Pontibacter ummariensis]PRY04677.1 anti-sigma B factor antagonist [Pontibacter ummariensis]SNT22948.1 anti-sigma B factor antagonist [Pontibacter ummariensis]